MRSSKCPPPEIKVVTPATLEEAAQRLADARQALASIQEANRRDGVMNEHTLHSENAAAQLIESLGKELAHLKGSVRNIDVRTRFSRTPENNMKALGILANKAEHPEDTTVPCKTGKVQ